MSNCLGPKKRNLRREYELYEEFDRCLYFVPKLPFFEVCQSENVPKYAKKVAFDFQFRPYCTLKSHFLKFRFSGPTGSNKWILVITLLLIVQ